MADTRKKPSSPVATDVHRALNAHNEAIGFAKTGDLASATSRLLHAVQVAGPNGVDPRSLRALYQVAISNGDWKTGFAAGVLAAVRDPGDFAFVNRVLQSLARCPPAELLSDVRYPLVSLPEKLPTLSVVLVSQDDARFAAVDAEYERAFSGWPHERIRVKGAHSMYEGYGRGFASSRGEIVAFSHDDIRFAVPDFAARLARAMETSDMVGVAGTTRVTGPALLWAGHPHLFGTIAQKSDEESDYEFMAMSLEGPRIAAAQGLDGVFIAVRRDWVARVGFDPVLFNGFHFYDLDFSYRAHLAGARVTIAGDLALIHRSRGQYDERWTEAQDSFERKFPASEVPGKDRHWYAVRLPDAGAVSLMYAKLFAAWDLTLM